jgi:hypothetical protein
MSKCDSCSEETESTSLTRETCQWLCDECLDSYCEEHGNYGVCIDPDAWKYELERDYE